MTDFENGRFYPRGIEGPRQSRQHFQETVEASLGRIERTQDSYNQRLTNIEERLNSQLQLVADNTTSMSRSLELIQASNTKLIDVISHKGSVPTGVVIAVVAMLAGVFLTRELAISGGRAKLGLSGVAIESNGQSK